MNIVTESHLLPEPWTAEAACLEVDPDAFFPELGEPNRAAKRICGGCDVRQQCLEYALKNREPYGIWGGLATRERHEILMGRAA